MTEHRVTEDAELHKLIAQYAQEHGLGSLPSTEDTIPQIIRLNVISHIIQDHLGHQIDVNDPTKWSFERDFQDLREGESPKSHYGAYLRGELLITVR